jgi:hypothetical protein
MLTAGQKGDAPQAAALLEGLPAEVVMADTAYDADAISAAPPVTMPLGFCEKSGSIGKSRCFVKSQVTQSFGVIGKNRGRSILPQLSLSSNVEGLSLVIKGVPVPFSNTRQSAL